MTTGSLIKVEIIAEWHSKRILTCIKRYSVLKTISGLLRVAVLIMFYCMYSFVNSMSKFINGFAL